MSKPLTTRQKSVYEFIESYILQKGYGPTVREIAEAVHLSSPSTVHVHLKTLEEKGYIVRDPLKSRSIALPGKHEQEEAFGSTGARNLETSLAMLRQVSRFLQSKMSRQLCNFPQKS